MRILILGGTGFLGPHLVDQAMAKGWEVTLFNRGRTDLKCDAGARLTSIRQLRGDRDPNQGAGLQALEILVAAMRADGTHFDAVIDNSSYVPRITRAAAELLEPVARRYQLVSTISVYADSAMAPDESTPVGTLSDPTVEEVTAETYGPLKALCEQEANRVFTGRCCVVRPGLIVGPGDKSRRFTYWPVRIAEGGRVLAPRAPQPDKAWVQFIDVRDLAAFMLRLLEDDRAGTWVVDGPGKPLTMAEMLAGINSAFSVPVEFCWCDEAWLLEQGVAPWMGLPLWIPQVPEHAGWGRADCSKAFNAGLSCRPLADTARDTVADFERSKGELSAGFMWGDRAPGISRERERELLEAWGTHQGMH